MRDYFLLLLIVLPGFCFADTIIFTNGRELEGKVLEQDETTMLLEVEFGTMRVLKSMVVRVDPDTPEKLAKREAARKAREEAAAQRTAAQSFEDRFKAKAEEQAKAKAAALAAKAKARAEAKAAAKAKTAANAAQNNQPRWSDQYVNWRRTRRTSGTAGPGNYTRNRNSRNDRMARNPYTGPMKGNQSSSRARMPYNVNQLPNGVSDLARKYLGGRGR